MGKETVFAKAEGYGVRRRDENGVGAQIVVGGDDGERRRRPVPLQNQVDLFPGDQGNVARHLQHAAAPFADQPAGRRRDDFGVAAPRLVGKHARAAAFGDPGGGLVRGRHDESGKTGCGRQGVQHVFEHGEGKGGPQMGRHEISEPLLRRSGFLDGDDGPDAGLSQVRRAISGSPVRRKGAETVSGPVRARGTPGD